MLLTTNTDFLGLCRLAPASRLASSAIGKRDNVTGSAFFSSGGIVQAIGTPSPVRVRAGGNPADTGQTVIIYGYTVSPSGILSFSKDTVVTAGASASAPTSLSFAFVDFVRFTGVVPNVGDVIFEDTVALNALVQVSAGRGVSEAAVIGLPPSSVALIQRLQVRVLGSNPLSAVRILAPSDALGFLPSNLAWFDEITPALPLDAVFDPPLIVPSAATSGNVVDSINLIASSALATSAQAILSATVVKAVSSTLF